MEPAIEIKNLSVVLDGQKVLKDISISLPVGGIIGLLGPNGAGKTTLIRSIMGRLHLAGGSITVFGLPAGSKQLRSEVGYMPQSTSIYPDLSVKENVRYFAVMSAQASAQAEAALREVEMSQQADKLVSQLSGGQKSRVSLAIALLGRPKLLVLDEPTVGLDPLLRTKLWRLFKRLANQGITFLVSSHVMDEATHCDNLLLLRDGKTLTYSPPNELLKRTHAKSIEASFIKLIGER